MDPTPLFVPCFAPEILRAAIVGSLTKLDPRVQLRNPVMFVVEVGGRRHDRRVDRPGVRGRAARRRATSGLVHVHRGGVAVG